MNKLLQILMMVPGIIQSIEVIHGNSKSGAQKKDLAMQSLGLAVAVGQAIAPEHQNDINAYAAFASNLIDSTVTLFNQTKQMPPPAETPAQAFAPASE